MSQGAAVKQSTSGEVEERNYVDGKLNGKVKILPQIQGQICLKTQINTNTNMVPNTNMMASIVDGCYKEKEDQYILFQATVIYSDSSKEQRTYKVSKLLFFQPRRICSKKILFSDNHGTNPHDHPHPHPHDHNHPHPHDHPHHPHEDVLGEQVDGSSRTVCSLWRAD